MNDPRSDEEGLPKETMENNHGTVNVIFEEMAEGRTVYGRFKALATQANRNMSLRGELFVDYGSWLVVQFPLDTEVVVTSNLRVITSW